MISRFNLLVVTKESQHPEFTAKSLLALHQVLDKGY